MASRRLLLSAVTVMAIAGCGSASEAGGPEPLAGRTFLSVPAVPGEDAMRLVARTRVRLAFQRGTVTAEAGCNQLIGDLSADGDRLVVTEVAGTLVGCSAELTDQDSRLTRFLQDNPRWQLTGDVLLLTTHETRLRLVDVRTAEPDRPLAGTRWSLETMMDKGTAGSVPAGADAYLRIEDGRVSGATSCTQFEGPVSTAKNLITFGTLEARKRSCAADLRNWDKAVLEVLRGAVGVRINGNSLQLAGAGERSLIFRAE